MAVAVAASRFIEGSDPDVRDVQHANPTMTDTVDNLILDLIEWVGLRDRTYQETMDAWRTSCPRLPVWEDACDRGFVERTVAENRLIVRATRQGLEFLEENRPNRHRRP